MKFVNSCFFLFSLLFLADFHGMTVSGQEAGGPFVKTDCLRYVEGLDPRFDPHCNQSLEVYNYNPRLKRCVKAIYSGCDPTNNNFKTIEECKEIAVPVCTESF